MSKNSPAEPAPKQWSREPRSKASTADVTYVSVIPEVLGAQPRLRELSLSIPPEFTREIILIESCMRNTRVE